MNQLLTLEQRVLDAVERILGPDGLVVRSGGRHEPEQLRYAMYVVETLTSEQNDRRVSMLEASTGIGKSLSYLVAVLAWIGLCKQDGEAKRAAISTFTRTLQRALIQTEIPRVQAHLDAIGIPPCSVTLRMGRRAYFSPRRVQRATDAIRRKHPDLADALDRFDQHVAVSCASGSGLILDWVEQVGPLPPGISESDVCLLDGVEPDSPAFIAHREAGRTADLVVTNHATVVLLARGLTRESEAPWNALVLDEAHLVSGAAETLMSLRVQTREVVAALRRLKVEIALRGAARGHEAALLAAESLHGAVSELTPSSALWRMPPEPGHALYRHAADVVKSINSMVSQLLRDCPHDEIDDAAEALQEVQETANAVSGWLSPQSNLAIPILQFSEKQRIGSLGTHLDAPGGVIKRLLSDGKCRLLLTSATLTSPRVGGQTFSEIRRALLISKQEVLLERTLSPSRYGDITKIVRMDASVPSPVSETESELDERTFQLNPTWVSAAAAMIAEAMREGPTLVLCLSHREAAELAKQLAGLVRNEPIFCHEPGRPLDELISDLRSANAGVLLSPGAWEGISLRDMNGEQLIRSLVIAHIPYVPVSSMTRDLFLWHASLRGVSAATANSSLQARSQHEVYQKLRQGIGRLIRSPHDRGALFIADPRFPAPGSTKRRALATAIPARFSHRYAESVVFSPGQPGTPLSATPAMLII